MTLIIYRWNNKKLRHEPTKKVIDKIRGFDLNSEMKDIGEIGSVSYYPSLEEICVWCDPKVRP